MCNSCLAHQGFDYFRQLDGLRIQDHRPLLSGATFQERRPLLIHLTVTGRCYARCQGCVNAAVTLGVDHPRNTVISAPETDPDRDARAVINLAALSPERDVVLCFYGGEPLLAVPKIARLMDLIEASPVRSRCRYMLITNGELLTQALNRHPQVIERLWLLAVSIDGRRSQHNRVRRGTDLARIHQNLRVITPRRRGPAMMWSTLREGQSLLDCFLEFMELCGQGWVEHFFWHWAEGHDPILDLPGYMRLYESDLNYVLEAYLQALSRREILSLVHINELILYLLTGKSRGASACGVELATNYDLSGGKIYPCADLPQSLAIGDIAPDGSFAIHNPDLQHLVAYKQDLGCGDCGVHAYCGGRCPVQAAAGYEILTQYCALMRLHVGVVQEYLPEIVTLLQQNAFTLQQLYEQSAFYTQFTDVTP